MYFGLLYQVLNVVTVEAKGKYAYYHAWKKDARNSTLTLELGGSFLQFRLTFGLVVVSADDPLAQPIKVGSEAVVESKVYTSIQKYAFAGVLFLSN